MLNDSRPNYSAQQDQTTQQHQMTQQDQLTQKHQSNQPSQPNQFPGHNARPNTDPTISTQDRTAFTGALRQVADLVSQLSSAYEQVLRLLLVQQEALLASDIHTIDAASRQLDQFYTLCSRAESQRLRHVDEISRLANLPFRDLTLNFLCDFADKIGEADISRSLGDSRTKLTALTSQIKEVTAQNGLLINRRTSYARFMLGAVSRATLYSPSGASQATKLSRLSIRA